MQRLPRDLSLVEAVVRGSAGQPEGAVPPPFTYSLHTAANTGSQPLSSHAFTPLTVVQGTYWWSLGVALYAAITRSLPCWPCQQVFRELMDSFTDVAHFDTYFFWLVPYPSKQWIKGSHCSGPVDRAMAQSCGNREKWKGEHL